MKILIAEDDPDQLSIRSMVLRQNGFEAVEAADLSSAVRIAAAEKPDCAIVDLRLPTEELGLRLIRELKQLNSAIHVFVLTGARLGGLPKRLDIGLVDEFLAKGSSSAELIRKLKLLDSRS